MRFHPSLTSSFDPASPSEEEDDENDDEEEGEEDSKHQNSSWKTK